jgi:diacylglycerol kinase family enzyme
MNVVLVYNPSSGNEFGLRHLRQLFRTHGVTIRYSFTTHQLSSKKLQELIRSGVIVAVVGGDGTLNSVARLLIHSESMLLPLPGGTFNHFVRDLGMAPTIDDILSDIHNATERTIDVAYVNDELFLNNSNLGLYPFSLIERKKTKKLVGKWIAAVLSVIDQLSVFRRHKLIIDGQRVRSPFVFVGNNTYDIKRSLIPQRTTFNKGVLTVMIATSRSRLALMRAVGAVIRGDVSRRDDFILTKRKSMAIYGTQSTVPVSFDGEVKRLAFPLEYRIERSCLRLLTVAA